MRVACAVQRAVRAVSGALRGIATSPNINFNLLGEMRGSIVSIGCQKRLHKEDFDNFLRLGPIMIIQPHSAFGATVIPTTWLLHQGSTLWQCR